jgi:nitrate reductase assembly molybdenum cofactor insertion protein NarJ
MKAPIYNSFSAVFNYPDAQYASEMIALQTALDADYPAAAKAFKPFSNWAATTDFWQIEEVYTKTFHIQAICYLDLGYVIFGEDYKRGEFLVNMKKEQFQAGNECGDELADNLANVLTLIPKLQDDGFRNELVALILMPAFEKMLAEFESSRMELKNKILRKKHKALIQEDVPFGNVYRNALESLQEVVMADFNTDKFKKPEIQPLIGGSFIAGCGTCGTPATQSFNKPSQLKKTA